MTETNSPMMKIPLIFLLLVWVPSLTTQNHYCSINSEHTLCKYQGLGPRCKLLFERGMPRDERAFILQMHNQMRSMIATGSEKRGRPYGPQPSASNMRQMEWDDELALSAQRLADQCNYKHDCLQCRKVDRFFVGQNLYQFSENVLRDKSNWNQAIRAWYDEVADFNPRTVDKFSFIKELGHYTQMVWADTYKIGCGYMYYNEGKWNRKIYVCNYGPAGNIITAPMYKRGAPCSECPSGTTCSSQYAGLCASASASMYNMNSFGSNSLLNQIQTHPNVIPQSHQLTPKIPQTYQNFPNNFQQTPTQFQYLQPYTHNFLTPQNAQPTQTQYYNQFPSFPNRFQNSISTRPSRLRPKIRQQPQFQQSQIIQQNPNTQLTQYYPSLFLPPYQPTALNSNNIYYYG